MRRGRRRRLPLLGGAVLLWWAASLLAVASTKRILTASVPFHALSATQFLASTASAKVTAKIRQTPTQLTEHEERQVRKIALIYAAGFLCTNYAFSLANAPLVETIKAAEPLTTVLFAALFLGDRETPQGYLGLGMVIIGVILASTTTIEFDTTILLATLLSNTAFSCRTLHTKILRLSSVTSDVTLFYHASKLSFFFALFISISVCAYDDRQWTQPFLANAILLVINGCAFSTYNLMSFVVLSQVESSTHAMLNVFRRAIVIILTALLFSIPLSESAVRGVSLATLGMCVFARAGRREGARRKFIRLADSLLPTSSYTQ